MQQGISEHVSPWYVTFFTKDVYWRVYAPFLTPERSLHEAKAMASLLELSSESQVLDIGCGTGRHDIPLAQLGYHVTGLDQSQTLLRCAQDDAGAHRVDVSWMHGDMRAIPYENCFDAVLNVFTSFGYFEREEEDKQVIHQVGRALRPGGRFLLDTVTLPHILHNFQPKHFHCYPDGLMVLEERAIDMQTNRYHVQVTLLTPAKEDRSMLRRLDYLQTIRIYSIPELLNMCAACGLIIEACYGDFNGEPLTESSRLVLLCRKRGKNE
ncbi:MAG: methyltransferase domain-containing protein [Ktedonobacteraceae bacterium]|nr:methyltransferase domain-containing protein [Ktedonobacteraceae bacterium]